MSCKVYQLLVLMLFTFSLIYTQPSNLQKKKFFKLEKLSICENDSILPISMENVSYYINRNMLMFKGSVRVKEVIDNPVEHSFFLWKCKSINDRCEIFTNNSSPDFCDMVQRDEGTIFPMIKPRMACPIQPGVYDISESTFNLDSIAHLPIEGNLWHLEVFILRRKEEEDDKILGCMENHIRVFLSSSRVNRG